MNAHSQQYHTTWFKQCLNVRVTKQQWTVFSTMYYAFLKAHHQIIPKPGMESALVLLTSDISSYDLPDLNVKKPDK